MRYVNVGFLRPDMTLARPILGVGGEVLLQEGVPLRRAHIGLLRKHYVAGVFVLDRLSEGIEIPELIPVQLRASAVYQISETYSQAARRMRSRDPMALLGISARIVDEAVISGETPSALDVKSYDYSTYFHVLHAAELSVMLGLGLGLETHELSELAYAALFHDIGKMFIDARIIEKPGPLDQNEMALVRRHPYDGQRFLKQKYPEVGSEAILSGVLEHHERLDGSGYPHGKKADDICDFAKIISICEVYDAMTSECTYRHALPPARAVEHLKEGRGTLYDAEMIDVFLTKVAPYPVGTCVKLTDGSFALVAEIDADHIERPKVRVFRQGENYIKPFELDLSGKTDIRIEDAADV
jgi:HD-GYP domain-containing protein (c-di-GMP phosphodiesterase class II)